MSHIHHPPRRRFFKKSFHFLGALATATVLARIENAFITEEEKGKILSKNLQELLKKVQT